jgi:hypothetical protein
LGQWKIEYHNQVKRKEAEEKEIEKQEREVLWKNRYRSVPYIGVACFLCSHGYPHCKCKKAKYMKGDYDSDKEE